MLNPDQKIQSKENVRLQLADYKGQITANGMDFNKSIEEAANQGEIAEFDTLCYACDEMGKTRTTQCTIPYFKEIVIMCFECDKCGYKSSEIKGGGGIPDKAKKVTLKVKTKQDLDRCLYKSESCTLAIPEVGIEIDAGTMGSMYTNVEGIVDQLYNNLRKCNPYKASLSKDHKKYKDFLKKLIEV